MQSAELTSHRTSRTALERELRDAGSRVIRGNTAQCPFHDDRSPSGSIFQSEGGVWRFRCHTSTCGFHGDVFDIRAKREGRDLGEVLTEARGSDAAHEPSTPPKAKRVFASVDDIVASVSHLGPVEAHYDYTNPDTGKTEVVQIRYRHEGKKKFLTHHAVPGGFVLGAPQKPWPIYNRRRVRAAETVVVVEGEKCVHALHNVDIAATTSLSGAENADKADWSILAGKKVFIWPDNDAAGQKYAAAVVEQLDNLTPPPRMQMLRVGAMGLPDGGDVADFLAAGGDAQEVWCVLNDGSEVVGAGSAMLDRLSGIIDGTWRSIDWPWRSLSTSSKSLFPGTITVICGDPSTSKSFFVLQALESWLSQDVSADVLMLEGDKTFHQHRLLAMLSGRWEVLNDTWGRENPAELLTIHGEHEQAIATLAPHLHALPMGKTNYVDVLRWMKARCEAGSKVIVIDPITAVQAGDNRHLDDLSFIVSSYGLLIEHGARLVMISHPRTTFGKRATMDDVAGGRAFSRHTDTVLMLHRHDPPTELTCDTSCGNAEYSCNRTIRIAKARNAPGHGWRIGYSLGADVRFHEHGAVIEKVKKKKSEEPTGSSYDES